MQLERSRKYIFSQVVNEHFTASSHSLGRNDLYAKYNSTLSAAITELQKYSGLTDGQFAKELGVYKESLIGYKNGSLFPNEKTTSIISEALGFNMVQSAALRRKVDFSKKIYLESNPKINLNIFNAFCSINTETTPQEFLSQFISLEPEAGKFDLSSVTKEMGLSDRTIFKNVFDGTTKNLQGVNLKRFKDWLSEKVSDDNLIALVNSMASMQVEQDSLGNLIDKAIKNGSINTANKLLDFIKSENREEIIERLATYLKIDRGTLDGCIDENKFGAPTLTNLQERHNLNQEQFNKLIFINGSKKDESITEDYSKNEAKFLEIPNTENYYRGYYNLTKHYQNKLADKNLTQKQKLELGDEFFRKVIEFSGYTPSRLEDISSTSHQFIAYRSISNHTQGGHFDSTEKLFNTLVGEMPWLKDMMIDTSFGLDKRRSFEGFISALKSGEMKLPELIFFHRTQNRITTWEYAREVKCKPALVNHMEASKAGAVYPNIINNFVAYFLKSFEKSENDISIEDLNALKIAFRGGNTKVDDIKNALNDAFERKINSGDFIKFVLKNLNMSLNRMVELYQGKDLENPPTRAALFKWSQNKPAAIESMAVEFAKGLGIFTEEEIDKCKMVLMHRIPNLDKSILSELEGGSIDNVEAFNRLYKGAGKTKDKIEKAIGAKKGYYLIIERSGKVPSEFCEPLMKEFSIEEPEDKKIFLKHFSTELSIHDLRYQNNSAKSNEKFRKNNRTSDLPNF